jgi:helicase
MLAALKMGLVARDWTRSSDADDVAEKHNCYAFEIERLRESLDRLLLAMIALFEKAKGDKPPESLLIQPGGHISLAERVKVLRQMIAAGINEAAATLTIINGIGPKLAKHLYEKGIADIEDLASSEVEELTVIQRLSPDRARRWITEAKEKIRFRSAFSYREGEPTANVKTPDWAPEVDPYRLRRALDLKIAGAEGGMFRITGGLEPHVVRTVDGKLSCDCQDAAKAAYLPIERRRQCKHALAVRLYRGDRKLRKLARQLNMRPDEGQLNLFDLWFGSSQSAASRRRL